MTQSTSPLRSKRFFLGAVGLVLVALVAVGWWQRGALLAWYNVRGLAAASHDDRAAWVDRVAGLPEDVVLPRLLNCLRADDERGCANVRAALERLTQGWEPGDPRRLGLSEQLAKAFAGLSVPGQRATLELGARLLVDAEPGQLTATLARLAAESARGTDGGIRSRALGLADALLERDRSSEVVQSCRELTKACLSGGAVEHRLEALHLALRPGIDLLEQVVPLLSDPQPEVRRTALLAVGAAQDVLATDDLLRWLHDPDDEVRRLCEQALRARGLHEQHLKLGRLLTDARPGTRLQVLDQLRRAQDLDAGAWLRRLSHDAAPAVRAAAVRAAAEQTLVDLSDRLEQMAHSDPSQTVRQLARHYLDPPKSQPHSGSHSPRVQPPTVHP